MPVPEVLEAAAALAAAAVVLAPRAGQADLVLVAALEPTLVDREVLAVVVADVVVPLVERVDLEVVVVEGQQLEALAALQSFASTTKEQPCTTHLLNPTL